MKVDLEQTRHHLQTLHTPRPIENSASPGPSMLISGSALKAELCLLDVKAPPRYTVSSETGQILPAQNVKSIESFQAVHTPSPGDATRASLRAELAYLQPITNSPQDVVYSDIGQVLSTQAAESLEQAGQEDAAQGVGAGEEALKSLQEQRRESLRESRPRRESRYAPKLVAHSTHVYFLAHLRIAIEVR